MLELSERAVHQTHCPTIASSRLTSQIRAPIISPVGADRLKRNAIVPTPSGLALITCLWLWAERLGMPRDYPKGGHWPPFYFFVFVGGFIVSSAT